VGRPPRAQGGGGLWWTARGAAGGPPAAMVWFRDSKDSKDGVERVKSGEEVSRTDRLKMFGKLIGASISSASSAAHDKMLLKKHEKLRVGEPSAGTFGTARISIDAIAAADLRHPRVGNPDPYCLVAVGRVGAPWAEKARSGAVAKTPVALRQRHPKWLTPLALPLPAEGDDMELTVRVMDAHVRGDACVGEARLPLRDTAESGAVTVRLLGGGFASCSIRWSVLHLHGASGEALLQPPSLEDFCADVGNASSVCHTLEHFETPDAPPPDFCPPERGAEGGALQEQPEASRRRAARGAVVVPSSLLREKLRERPFATAFEFWRSAAADAASSPSNVVEGEAGSGPSARALRHVVAALAEPPPAERTPAEEARDRAGVNELILQAPLAWALASDGADLVVEAISGSLDLLEPLARSRLAGVLLEQLKQGSSDDNPTAAGKARKKEKLVWQLLKTSLGDSLMELKRLIDTAGTGQNLLSVCGEISPELCTSLMDHFLVEGSKVMRKPIHVLSDIDMTVWVGTFGAGGPKFPQGPIPGALQLFQALGGRITFLSARPPVWESRTRGALLDDIGIAEATVLQGTLENVVRCLFQPAEARRGMGQQKEKAFNEFVDLYPEARFVFFGDSGEGDVDFALAFMQDAAGAAAVSVGRVALIHDVVGADGVEPKTSPEEREALGRRGVHVFDTYVGAALHLFRLGILDEGQLRRAAQSCADELYERAPGEFRSLDVSKARTEELRRDLDAMAAVLGAGDRVAPAPCPPRRGNCPHCCRT